MDTKWLTELGKKLSVPRSQNGSYNIFQVLRIEDKEVLICRFLGDLLNPKGSHGCGIHFLKHFFKHLTPEAVPETELENAEVVLEEHTDKNRRIDIVIHLSTEVYPIEVKIWAGDQDEQLYDYWEYCKKLNARKIYYLTPTGWKPSEKSAKGLPRNAIKCLSFQDDIMKWLGDCELVDSPEVRATVKQFKEVIEHMCKSAENWKAIETAVFEGGNPDQQRAVFGILEHADSIKRKFQEDFIRNHIELPDGWEFAEPQDDEKKTYKYAVLKVVSGKTGNVLGYLCVETNLYIYATKIEQLKDKDKWKDTNDTDARPWRYLTPDSKPINLRNPLDSQNPIDVFDPNSGKINLSDYLEEA